MFRCAVLRLVAPFSKGCTWLTWGFRLAFSVIITLACHLGSPALSGARSLFTIPLSSVGPVIFHIIIVHSHWPNFIHACFKSHWVQPFLSNWLFVSQYCNHMFYQRSLFEVSVQTILFSSGSWHPFCLLFVSTSSYDPLSFVVSDV